MDRQGLGGGDEARHELVIDRGVDEQSRSGQADLSGVAEDCLHGPVDRIVEVSIAEDDIGALAAELERYRRQMR